MVVDLFTVFKTNSHVFLSWFVFLDKSAVFLKQWFSNLLTSYVVWSERHSVSIHLEVKVGKYLEIWLYRCSFSQNVTMLYSKVKVKLCLYILFFFCLLLVSVFY